MSDLPWTSIEDAPQTGHPVFVWNGNAMLWATWSRPRLDPGGRADQAWCNQGRRLKPPPSHWLPLAPPSADAACDDSFRVHAHFGRRSPDGSSACYVVSHYTTWRRCTEHGGSETISSETASGIAAA